MLTVVTSHPIQYQAPIWRALAEELPLRFQVLFLTPQGVETRNDREFGKAFRWDVDLLSGYPSRFLQVNQDWDMSRFRGIRVLEPLDEAFLSSDTTRLWVEGWRFQPFWQAVRTAKKLGIKVTLRGESNDLKELPRWKGWVKRIVLHRLFSAVDDFLVIGSANRRFYQGYGVSDTKLHSAPYCVDNDKFVRQSSQLRPDRDRIRSEWSIPPDAKCLLFCGKFIDKKHPMDLIRAAELLLKDATQRERLHLLFVGSGVLDAQLRDASHVVFNGQAAVDESDRDHTKPRASFCGFLNQSEIAKAFVAADLLVLPSDAGETWGLVVNEAMSCGLPAVVSHLCGCAEDLPAKLDPRLVYRHGEIEQLVKAIQFGLERAFSPADVVRIADSHHLRHTVSSVLKLVG